MSIDTANLPASLRAAMGSDHSAAKTPTLSQKFEVDLGQSYRQVVIINGKPHSVLRNITQLGIGNDGQPKQYSKHSRPQSLEQFARHVAREIQALAALEESLATPAKPLDETPPPADGADKPF